MKKGIKAIKQSSMTAFAKRDATVAEPRARVASRPVPAAPAKPAPIRREVAAAPASAKPRLSQRSLEIARAASDRLVGKKLTPLTKEQMAAYLKRA